MPKSKHRFITKIEVVTYREEANIPQSTRQFNFEFPVVSRSTIATISECPTERQAEKEKVKFLAAWVMLKTLVLNK